MKIRFEFWVNENITQIKVKKAFEEAIVCYKASAYRAALLLSYCAFMNIIMYKLIASKTPPACSEGEWNQIRKDILDDEKREKKIYEALLNNKNKYFKLSDSIKSQITYWKDRRNDCAHLKENLIDNSHVESFWLFITSNINKINVIGSDEDLISKIKNHYNVEFTPYFSDPTMLIKEIPSSISVEDFNDFLMEIESCFENIEKEDWFYIGENAEFFYIMLNILDSTYYDIVKDFILKNDELSKSMFTRHPIYLNNYCKDNPSYVRKMWTTNNKNPNKARTASILLRNSIIPNNEIKELIDKTVYTNNDNIPAEEDVNFLIPFGYLKKIDEVIAIALTEETSLKWWVDENMKFIRFYNEYSLKHKRDEYISKLIMLYNHINNEKAESIYNSFFKILIERDDMKDHVKKIAEDEGNKEFLNRLEVIELFK